MSTRPACPVCRKPMAQTAVDNGQPLYSCTNYSGGCVNTKRLYTRGGSRA